MDNITILKEEDTEKKQKKKRTYAQQAERIKTYLKNRYANDADFREKTNKERLIRSNIRYNTDEEYRLKKLEYVRQKNNIKNAEINKIKNEEMIKQFEELLNNNNNITYEEIKKMERLHKKIIKKKPDYVYTKSI